MLSGFGRASVLTDIVASRGLPGPAAGYADERQLRLVHQMRQPSSIYSTVWSERDVVDT